MPRILTGIQSTNIPHLGNLLGALMPAIALSRNQDNECLFFIADLHTLTSQKDPGFMRESTAAVAATWLAFGLDTKRSLFYRQSRVPQVAELTWYLNCFTPYPMLANAHSFKDKSERLADVNAGLFTYPVLMAADILLYDAELVPVGKDQVQHLEIASDIARAFNHRTGQEIFIEPRALVDERVMIVPGTDGQKMSKSYKNFINIFLPEKELKKVVMGIVTDSKGLEESKNADTDNVYRIYRLLASSQDAERMKENYARGGYGYGHAKTELYSLILEKFSAERAAYDQFMGDRGMLEHELSLGEKRAAERANKKLEQVRGVLGYTT
jgi:tryptophanyl-tRNA synthetase